MNPSPFRRMHRRQASLSEVAVVLALLLASLALSSPARVTGSSDADPQLPGYHFVPLPHNWMNDPNGPFFDPVHKLYHLMYQYETPRVWGHAVSDDLLHWTQLPVALENDEWYDKGGVFSGSATILDDGTPVMSYSVSTDDMQCLAAPANRSDPWLVKWVKNAQNPVISSRTSDAPHGRDDTTAWKSRDGRVWRMAYGWSPDAQSGAAIVFTSNDFLTWKKAGNLHASNSTGMWECPDFFAIPGASKPTSRVTHVLKASLMGDRREYWVTGTYDDDRIIFTPFSDKLDMGSRTQMYDAGPYYASKSFLDSSTGDQVLWGWVPEERAVDDHGGPYGWASVMSLPRLVVLDEADGIRIRTPPHPALEKLRLPESRWSYRHRESPSLPCSRPPVSAGGLGDNRDDVLPVEGCLASPLPIAGDQLELVAVFSVPSNGAFDCGLQIRMSSDQREVTTVGVGTQDTSFMPLTDLAGLDYNVTAVSYTDPHVCQSACMSDARCKAWTYVFPVPGQERRCCLKEAVPAEGPCTYCASGVNGGGLEARLYGDTIKSSLNTKDQHAANRMAAVLPPGVALASGKYKLHVFVDHSVIEVFGNDGQSAVTRRVYPTLPDATGVGVYSTGSCHLESMDAWAVASTPVLHVRP